MAENQTPQEDQITEISGNKYITQPHYVIQYTLQYKTYLKRAIVEALQDAFRDHPDPELAKTRIGIDYDFDRADFPAIIIKFWERSIKNAGVGHKEWGPAPDNPNYPEGPYTTYVEYNHRVYEGDLEFEIYALTTTDRDKVVDAIVEVIAMREVTPMGIDFETRVYDALSKTPYGTSHYIAMNTDVLTGFGETSQIAPWIPEDTLVYQTAYRLPIMGEFYSKMPESESEELVSGVNLYPYDPYVGELAPSEFPEEIIPEDKFIKIKPIEYNFKGNITKESPEITFISSEQELTIGMPIFGKGIAEGAKITAFLSSNRLKMSIGALETATNVELKAKLVKENLPLLV